LIKKSRKRTKRIKKTRTININASEIEIKTYITKNSVKGSLILLKNARIITMNGREIIEKGDVLIIDNRIS
jgi:hypothetical protein